MRKLTLAAIFLLSVISNAHAVANYADVEPSWTYYSADRVDGGYFPLYFPPSPAVHGKPDASLKYFLGGPGGRDGGRAFNFEVDQETHVDALIFDAHAYSAFDKNGSPDYGYLNFDFNLYAGGKVYNPGSSLLPVLPNIPDINTKALSSPVQLTDDVNVISFEGTNHYIHVDKFYKDFLVPFNADLPKGSYWLAAETAGGEHAKYGNIRLASKVAAVPEPATVLLLTGGLAGMFMRRRLALK